MPLLIKCYQYRRFHVHCCLNNNKNKGNNGSFVAIQATNLYENGVDIRWQIMVSFRQEVRNE